MIVIIVVVVFIIIFFLIITNKSNHYVIDRNEIKNSTPLQILELIKNCPIDKIESLRFELFRLNKLKNPIISEIVDLIIIDRADVIDYNFYAERIKIGEVNKSEPKNILGYELLSVFTIAGVHIDDRKKNIVFKVSEGDEVILITEPDNIYDASAIKVIWNDRILGYIPKYETHFYSEKINDEKNYKAFVYDVILKEYGYVDCEIAFYIKK